MDVSANQSTKSLLFSTSKKLDLRKAQERDTFQTTLRTNSKSPLKTHVSETTRTLKPSRSEKVIVRPSSRERSPSGENISSRRSSSSRIQRKLVGLKDAVKELISATSRILNIGATSTISRKLAQDSFEKDKLIIETLIKDLVLDPCFEFFV